MRTIKLPSPYYQVENEQGSEKTEVEKQREAIKVTSTTTKAADEKLEDNNDAEDSVDEEVKTEEAEEGEESEEETGKEENEEEVKELTPEQKEIEALKKKLERAQRRAGKTAAERDENKKKVRELQAALDAKVAEGEQPLTEEEVNRRAREIANTELTTREFNQAQTRLIEEATKIDKTFMSKINDLAQDVAPLPEFFIGALNDLDNGGAVLNYLSDNPDDYEELLKKNNPMKVMKGLVDISNKLTEAAKPKPKKISNVPEPPKAIKGNSKSPDQLPPKPTENMAEFIRVRNMQEKAKREAKMR